MKMSLAILTLGQIAGDREISLNYKDESPVTYKATLTCQSVFGELYCIKKEDFLSKIKYNPISWKLFLNIARERDQDIRKHIKLLTGIKTKIKDFNEKLKKNETFLDDYMKLSDKYGVTISPPPIYWANQQFTEKIIKSYSSMPYLEKSYKEDIEENKSIVDFDVLFGGK